MARLNAQDQDKYIVRLPNGMRDRLKQSAAEAGRSLNAEMVARLEASFQVSTLNGEVAALIERHIRQAVDDRLTAIAQSLSAKAGAP